MKLLPLLLLGCSALFAEDAIPPVKIDPFMPVGSSVVYVATFRSADSGVTMFAGSLRCPDQMTVVQFLSPVNFYGEGHAFIACNTTGKIVADVIEIKATGRRLVADSEGRVYYDSNLTR